MHNSSRPRPEETEMASFPRPMSVDLERGAFLFHMQRQERKSCWQLFKTVVFYAWPWFFGFVMMGAIIVGIAYAANKTHTAGL